MTVRRHLIWLLCGLLPGCFQASVSNTGGDGGTGAGSHGTAGTGGGSTSTGGSSHGGSGSATGGEACQGDADCDDADPCTMDACAQGQCTHDPADDPSCSCTTAADCTQLPPDDDCRTRTCVGGTCGQTFAAEGTPVGDTGQTAEDCQQVVCDGHGATKSVADDTDLPVDGLECTDDVCTGGVPSNPPVPEGTSCAAGTCDGNGGCTGCTAPADCGGTDTFCEHVTCNGGVCGIDDTAGGTPLPDADQTAGDCRQLQCDGRGNAAPVADETDPPDDDGNDCTDDVCQGSTAAHPDLPADTLCNSGGGIVCDGNGTCVPCNHDGQCAGDGNCMAGACSDHQCGLTPASSSTPCNDGLFCTASDACDGNGTCVGSGDPCPGPDGDADCSEMCNEATGSCTGNDPGGSACNDGLFCTASDVCNGNGVCQGSGTPCPGPDGDNNCSESCNETANDCSGADPNGSHCGNCSLCSFGSCQYQCSGTQHCCPGNACLSNTQQCN